MAGRVSSSKSPSAATVPSSDRKLTTAGPQENGCNIGFSIYTYSRIEIQALPRLILYACVRINRIMY